MLKPIPATLARLLMGGFALCATSHAATFTVINTNATGGGSLHQAVADATGSDTINFDASLSGQSIQLNDTLVVDQNLTIDASALAAGIKILGLGRVLEITAGRTVVLRKLELRNGWSNQGGGIYNAGILTLHSCTIANNGDGTAFGGGPTAQGGGIYNAGTLTLNGCTLTGNIANAGAAIHIQGGASLAVNNSTITGNDGVNGTGGISNFGSLTLTNTVLSGNTTGGFSNPNLSNADGSLSVVVVTTVADSGIGSLRDVVASAPIGATIVFALDLTGKTITLTSGEILLNTARSIDASALAGGVTISGNNAIRIFNIGASGNVTLVGLKLTNGQATNNHGGAIFNEGRLTVDRCTLSGNTASLDGGGIFNPAGSQVTLLNSTFNGNTAREGGAVRCTGAAFAATNCTFTANTASIGGACSIADGGPEAQLTHVTIAGNQATGAIQGGGLFFYGQNAMLHNCIVAGNSSSGTGADIAGTTVTLTFQGTNLIQLLAIDNANLVGGFSNQAPLLAPLGNHGGPTQTMPPLSGSPAIDAGGSSARATDQRGFPILALPDLGAVEIGIRVTTAVDELDATSASGSGISLREAVRDTPAGGMIAFAASLNGRTITLTRAAEIELNKSVTIDASSLPAGLTIDGGPGTNRIFSVNDCQVSLLGMTLTGGNGAGTDPSGPGGAIMNFGNLTLTRCTLSGNSASPSQVYSYWVSAGGAIYSIGRLTLQQCTLIGNSASSDSANGGAISHNLRELTMEQCTLTGNSASAGSGFAHGGALHLGEYASCTLKQCTFSGNPATGLSRTGATISLFTESSMGLSNSIVIGGIDLLGGSTMNTSGVNFFGNLEGSNLTQDPHLAPLGNYGGPTQTMPPMLGSPVIDATIGSTVTTDQRGFPIVGTPDLGAAEAVVAAATMVTTPIDELDEPGTIGNGISLREAVRDTPVGRTIEFDARLSGETFTLDRGELVINKSLAIDASSLPTGLTIHGGGQGTNRIFTVNGSPNVTLGHLTLTGGNGAGARLSGSGGAILNNEGKLMLIRCTLTGNSAPDGGGAILNELGALTLRQCTLSGNSARSGGAIQNLSGLSLTHCTLVENSARDQGGAIGGSGFFVAGSLNLANSIIAGNTAPLGPDLLDGGPISLSGVNFIGNLAGSGITAGVSILTGNPHLAPLGNYGGPARTMALKPGSPARNAAKALSPAITSDQRGFPIVGTPDIGAYEAGTIDNFATWAWETAGTELTFDDDNEQDGASNGLEYATRRDPNVSDTLLSPALAPTTSGGRHFEFRYQKNARDLRYIVQRGSNLGPANTWTEIYRYDTSTGQITRNGVTGIEDAAKELIILTDPATGPRLFWRLVIEPAP